jgi:N-acetylneuraminate synthase
MDGVAVRLGEKNVGDGHAVLVIADLGDNHDGSIDVAKRLVSAAARVGADAVKVSVRTPERFAPTVEYRQKLELSARDVDEIGRACAEHGLALIVSCFDGEALDRVRGVANVAAYEAPLTAIDDVVLVEKMKATDKPLFILADPSATRAAVRVADALGHDLLVAHASATFPCPVDQVNLKMIATLRERLPEHPIGYAGNEVGIAPTLAAVGLGASFVARKLTLDRCAIGPEHAASLEPNAFAELVMGVRDIERALGDGVARAREEEEITRETLRRVRNSDELPPAVNGAANELPARTGANA